MNKKKKLGLALSLAFGSIALASTGLLAVSCTNNSPTLNSYIDVNKLQEEINKNNFSQINELATSSTQLKQKLTSMLIQNDSKPNIKEAKAQLLKQNDNKISLNVNVVITNNEVDYLFDHIFTTNITTININKEAIQNGINSLFATNTNSIDVLSTKFTSNKIIDTITSFKDVGFTKDQVKAINTTIANVSVDQFIESNKTKFIKATEVKEKLNFDIELQANVCNYLKQNNQITFNQNNVKFDSLNQITISVSESNVANFGSDAKDPNVITGLSTIGKTQATISIPSNVKEIKTLKSTHLQSITLENSSNLEMIGANAFDGNSKMNSIVWPKSSKLTSIGAYAFKNTGFQTLDLSSFNFSANTYGTNNIFKQNSLASIKSNMSSSNQLEIKVANKESAESLINTKAFGTSITIQNAEENGLKFVGNDGNQITIKPEIQIPPTEDNTTPPSKPEETPPIAPEKNPFGQIAKPINEEDNKKADPNGLITKAFAKTDGNGNTILFIQGKNLPQNKNDWSISKDSIFKTTNTQDFEIDNTSTETEVKINIKNTNLNNINNADLDNIKFSFTNNNLSITTKVVDYAVHNKLEFKFKYYQGNNFVQLEKLMSSIGGYEIKPLNPIGRAMIKYGIPQNVVNNKVNDVNKFIKGELASVQANPLKNFFESAVKGNEGILLTELKNI